jgi:prolyl-tRNA synthetase
MPINLYQIQTKFRDEIRPRFGVMRAREFIMKDAYSFDVDEEGANGSYEIMYNAYSRIFQRCGLTFRAVEADTGTIGGSFSHEFMVLAATGEDAIVSCTQCGYAANLERAEVRMEPDPQAARPSPPLPREEVETPGIKTVEEVTSFLSISANQLIKTLILLADDDPVAALVRGDHDLNEVKLKNFLGAQSVELADADRVAEITGAPMGFAGPQDLKIRVVADQAIRGMNNVVTGGNQKDLHLKNMNVGRDFDVHDYADLRVITPADVCPRCGESLDFQRGIEVGHIFKLGVKYSEALKAMFLDEGGKEKPIVMGCYGIGVGRTVAAAIEQNHDENGIVFPIPLAPFEVTLLPLQMHDAEVVETARTMYEDLGKQGFDVLLDDRDERAGVKFNDADLLGIPVRVTVGRRGIQEGQVELKLRGESQTATVPIPDAAAAIADRVNALYDSIT